MRTIEITYKIKGELKESSYNVRTSGEAIKLLLTGLSRRDKLSFKIVKISMFWKDFMAKIIDFKTREVLADLPVKLTSRISAVWVSPKKRNLYAIAVTPFGASNFLGNIKGPFKMIIKKVGWVYAE